MRMGTTIKYVRKSRGLTQRAAAGVLGISDVHLCNLEHDKARPSAGLLKKMYDEWGIEIYVLSWCLHGNTRLIAAAPMMLDALKAVQEQAIGNPCVDGGKITQDVLDGVRAAIQFATKGVNDGNLDQS